jgi:hypothetical protein
MITGGITDSDKVRESSAVTVFPESAEEALFDTVWLASVATFFCDLALETGVISLCDDSESACVCVVLSEPICTSLSRGKNSPCNPLFIENVENSVVYLLEDVKLPCLFALEDAESLGNLLEDTELLCTSFLHDTETPCGCVMKSVVPAGVSFFDAFGPHRISVLEVLKSLFICLLDVSEPRLIGLLEDVAPFCTCVREGADMLCTNLWEGVAIFCVCLLEGV